MFPHIPYETVLEMRDEIETLFITEKFKSILVLFTDFKSVMTQKVTLDTLLALESTGDCRRVKNNTTARRGTMSLSPTWKRFWKN